MSLKNVGIAAAIFVPVVFCLGFINLHGGNRLTQVVEALLIGWIAFPLTTLPKTSADWPSVFVGIAAVGLFLAGVHLLARRWQPWKFRWSIGIVAALMLLFTAGISVVGLTHQIGWLSSSEKPIFGPNMSLMHSKAATVQWQNRLKMTAESFKMGNDVWKQFPPSPPFTADGRMLHSWETHLLPYLPYDTSAIDMKIPWNDPKNAANFKGVIPEFINLNLLGQKHFDQNGFGVSHIAANSWIISADKTYRTGAVTDGVSTTILLGGINSNFPAWGNPINWRDPSIGINTSPHGFGGPPGSGGADFAMVDGSVRFVSDKISPSVLRALSTPSGGEKIDEGDWQP